MVIPPMVLVSREADRYTWRIEINGVTSRFLNDSQLESVVKMLREAYGSLTQRTESDRNALSGVSFTVEGYAPPHIHALLAG